MSSSSRPSAAAGGSTIDGHCGLCQAGCAARISLRAGRIRSLKPLPGHPQSILCRRSRHAAEIIYSPHRLLHPLRRVGPRGSGRFERVGWDEALNTVATRMLEISAAHGPEAVCLYTGRGTFELSLWEMLSPAGVRETSAWNLLFPFGSPNTTGAGSNCYVCHGVIAPVTTYGVWKIDTFADLEHSELIVVWGSNPANGSPPLTMHRIQQARRRGARVIVIDHRRTETARMTGAEWIGIRPGTDGALALAMIHVLIREGLHDQEFAQRWTVGFPELARYVEEFTPEAAQAITRVPADAIRLTARKVARARGAALLHYSGLEYTSSATQNIRAVLILWALAGNLDVPGGNVIKMPGSTFRVNQNRRLPPPSGVDPVGKDRYPLYHLYRKEAQAMELPEAILNSHPYPVRALLVFGASILTAYPNPSLWRRSLEALDFLMVVDRFPTGDSRYADIVLPACTAFEYESYLAYDRLVQLRRRLIEPLGEARSDWQIVAALADRLGYGHLYPHSSEEMLTWALEGTGVTVEQLREHPEGIELPEVPLRYRKWELGLLRRDGKPGFQTPSGKLEIASSVLAAHGYEPLPKYFPPREGPLYRGDLLQHFPLVFSSGSRNKAFFNSQYTHIPGLLAERPRPLVQMNRRDAELRGIRDGDRVFVIGPRGRVPFTALVNEAIIEGVVEADAHGGGPQAGPGWAECNVNELTDFWDRDPISGFPAYKALLCEVVKDEGGPVAAGPAGGGNGRR